MHRIVWTTRGTTQKLPPGDSKLLGNPDVWDGFVWPSITVDGENYDLTFLCQINCADVSGYDTGGRLPKSGMLYVFYDLDGMPWQPTDTNAARVIYYGGDTGLLHEMVLTDENGKSMAFAEQKIEFEYVAEDFLPEKEPTHLLLGVPSLDNAQDACIKDYHLLLQVASFETEDATISFTGNGVLRFFIDPLKLQALDFSDVRIKQSYRQREEL